nr:retrovirus-related Pol polyprotein from transposon TNT 1-94 [Tanacetum cinerariifolium]
MKSVIKYKIAKEIWTELCLAYKGLFDTRDTKIAALRLKFNAFKALKGEKVNGTYTQLKYLLNDLKNNRVIISQSEASSSKAMISNNHSNESDLDVKEDNKTNSEFIADLNAEYHEKALLENQKRANLENESLKDEISNLKKVIKKWTCSKVTLDNLLSQQIPDNIVKALGGKCTRKENNFPKEVFFTKADIEQFFSFKKVSKGSLDTRLCFARLFMVLKLRITKITWESLIKKQMMDSLSVIHQWLRPSDFSTSEHKRWKKHFMKLLVKMMKKSHNPAQKVMPSTSIRLKWVFRKKIDEEGVVTKNKARVVAKGYRKEEGISKSVKKQTSMAMSFAEAKYVSSARCCAQVLWIKSRLADYDVLYDKMPIFCDNTSDIAISNNPVLHSRIKHIDIRYYFIRYLILKGDIEFHFVPTDLQQADIFTKPLAVGENVKALTLQRVEG